MCSRKWNQINQQPFNQNPTSIVPKITRWHTHRSHLSQSKNTVCAFQITYQLLPVTFKDKKLLEEQCSSITKSSIYHIKHMPIQPFTMWVDWLEIGSLMEVSIMFDICTYCIFTFNLYSRDCTVQRFSFKMWNHETIFTVSCFLVLCHSGAEYEFTLCKIA